MPVLLALAAIAIEVLASVGEEVETLGVCCTVTVADLSDIDEL